MPSDARWFAVLLLLLVAPVGPVRADKGLAAERFKKGMAAYALEDWDAAIVEFDKGFREEPKPEFLYNIAQAHRQAGRPEPAIRFYQRYLDLKPDAADRPEVERLIRALRHQVSEKQRATSTPGGGVVDGRPPQPGVEPSIAPPSDHPADSARVDTVAIGLLASGAVVAAAGIGLAAYAAVAAGRATDTTTSIDLSERDRFLSRSNTTGVAGYVAIGAGVALMAGGVVKLALRPKRSVALGIGVAPGGAACTVSGRF